MWGKLVSGESSLEMMRPGKLLFGLFKTRRISSEIPDGGGPLACRFLEGLYGSVAGNDIRNRRPDPDKDEFERVVSFVLANRGDDFSARTISRHLGEGEESERLPTSDFDGTDVATR